VELGIALAEESGAERVGMRILAIGDIHGCSIALDALLEIVQPASSDLLITLGDYVHRGPDSLAEQPVSALRWECLIDPLPHESGKIMVCRHTSQKNGIPLNLGHTICIDTFAHGTGRLTCLDVESGQFWQSNQRADVRSGWIDEV
jgi:3',5'-cyclic AMP phosphodiesterase CpdA